MALPYKIATLLYCFNAAGDLLLLERAQEPNRGLYSPCGGKLKTDDGESPYQCACREAREEMGVEIGPADLHLTGLVSEYGYQDAAHWLMFLFEVKPHINELPPQHREGRFHFVRQSDLQQLPLPETDRAMIWPLFWMHRGGFFAAHCRSEGDGRYKWQIEQSQPLTHSAR